MKTSKRIISLVLCAVMVASTFFGVGFSTSFEAEAAITLGGITQQRVVSDYEAKYREYQKRFFKGEETNWPTEFVIPGLSSGDDYTPQGMTYWKAKEWILISAYDASGQNRNSVIYALDAKTTEFVAVFKIQNADGSVNLSHGGGIAASEHNFYYADSGSKISYVPLSEMDVAPGTTKTIKLKDSINLNKELNGVATSYCCYDEGVLWTGNFYFYNDSRYSTTFSSDYAQTLMGYRLAGNSSEEEWYYLKNGYNLVKLNKDSATETQTSGTMTYKTYNVDGANVEIRGNITTETAIADLNVNFGTLNLTEGKKYKIEYISDNMQTDMYLFAPGSGGHTNVTSSSEKTITPLGDGRYHYELIFSAGRKPVGADSSWPANQSTNGTYTGTYTIRFDQDNVPAGGRSFNITDLSVTEYVETSFTPDSKYEGIGCQGNPTYVILLNMDKIQYAMVDKGKIYISRSWSRTESDHHTRQLVIGDIDLTMPGNENRTINGRNRPVHIVKYDDCIHFGGDKKDNFPVSADELNKMLYMGEALCVIDDYLYMFGEGAAWTYNGKESNKCTEPIDVIWKIDQYAIQGLNRPANDVASVEYEKVYSLNEINDYDEYIILYEAAVKDAVTQDNILYLFDSYGGHNNTKLPKKDSASGITEANTGDACAVIGYEIRDYDATYDEQGVMSSIVISAEDDACKSIHWQFEKTTEITNTTDGAKRAGYRIKNRDFYFTKNQYLYYGDRLFAMTRKEYDGIFIKDWANDDFTFSSTFNGTDYQLWCNDGSEADKITKYTNFYSNHGKTNFAPNYHNLAEVPGTFHVNNGGHPATASGDQQGLHIYRRVADPYASTSETNVYTDLQAKLQADGTYTLTLETYATNTLQYQHAKNKRPTDFIFVIDSSGLMDGTEYYYGKKDTWTDTKVFDLMPNEKDSSYMTKESRVAGYKLSSNTHPYFYKTSDERFYQVFMAYKIAYASIENGTDCDGNKIYRDKYDHYFWTYIWDPATRLCYLVSGSTISETGITEDALKTMVNNGTSPTYTRLDCSDKDDLNDDQITKVPTYDIGTDEDRHKVERKEIIEKAVSQFIYEIEDHATETGLDHRIALVTYGTGKDAVNSTAWYHTSLYNNDKSISQYNNGINTSTFYTKAFFSKSQFGELRDMFSSNYDDGGHAIISNGLQMAYDIVKNSGSKYDVNGDRSAAVVVIGTGIPGYIDKAGFDATNGITTTKSIANDTLLKGAYELKRSGAHVFSVVFGDGTDAWDDHLFNRSEFNEEDFMKYLSSNYTGAKSMTDPGPLNTREDADYFIRVPYGTDIDINPATDRLLKVAENCADVATASLTDKSVLRETITDAFDLTGATATAYTVKSKYDGIGRLYFDEANRTKLSTEPTVTKTANGNDVEFTGFNYSEKNVSEYNSKGTNSKGEKLVIEITGVTANPNKTLTSAAINDKDTTALYESETHKNNNQALKKFQQYHFAIPEYTYVMDYDLPMLDTDINGTLISASELPNKQTTYVKDLQTDVFGVKFVDGDQNMLYSLNSQDGSAEDNSRAYILIKRDNGDYDWFRLNLIPASTVYYEDNKTATLDSTEEKGYTTWTPIGDYTNKYQSLSSTSDVYGNDPTYGNSKENFSLGTYLETTVSSSNNRSETKTFTFKGTGFDLYSACGTNTGIQTVTVKDSTGKLLKAYIVDTYYNDAKYGTIYQAPIVHFEGAHGEYTVETTAAYYSFAGGLQTQSVTTEEIEGTELEANSAIADVASTDELFKQIGMDELIGQEVEVIWMDENSIFNGGTGAESSTLSTQAGEGEKTLVNYIDGFRIYNPLNTNDKDYPESEQGAKYYNLIGNLGTGAMTGSSLFGYVEGNEDNFEFADYASMAGSAPKHEVYLTSNTNNGVSFKINVDGSNVGAKLSMRAVKGNPVVKVNDQEIKVSSTSEQYYDISGALNAGENIVTVKVTSSGTDDLVAIGNLRLNNASLTSLANEDLPNVARLMTMSAEPIYYDPNQAYVAPPTFVDAPADNPFIDPEGSIPDIGESGGTDDGTEEPVKNFFDIVVDFFRSIIERIKEVLQALPVLWTKNK